MIRTAMAATLITATLTNPAHSETAACTPSGLTLSTANVQINADLDFAEFQTTIQNASDTDLGGLIVEYTLTSPGRPSPLAQEYSQFTHTLEGGLLSGETTTIRDVLPISGHASNIIKSQTPTLSLDAQILLTADTELRPIGDGIDPFGLWKETRSPRPCP